MQLTPEQIQVGSENFNRVSNGLNDSDVSRRDFLKAAAAGTVGLGAAYFGYKKLEGGTGSPSDSSARATRGISSSPSIRRNIWTSWRWPYTPADAG